MPLAALALLVSTPARAQQQDEQLWLQVNTNVPLAKDLRITFEQIVRFSDRQGGLNQTEFGGLVGYRISKQIELGFGYRRVAFYNGNRAVNEDRIRQHIVGTFGPVTTRLRLDERFPISGGEVGFRLRPLTRYNHKLKGGNGLALFVSHESFYLPNTTSWGQRRGYERMRNIVGVTVPLAKWISMDAGYLNQYRFGRGGARAQIDHALTMQFTFDLERPGT